MNDTTLTTTPYAEWTNISVQPSIDYVQVQPQSCYPYPWNGWWPTYPQPWVYPTYIPQPVVAAPLIIQQGLSEDDIERIAEKVAAKLRPRVRVRRTK